VKDILWAEVEQLKLSYASDLERVLEGSKIRYYPNPLRALSPTGELEDLWQRLLEEIALQDKLRRRYGDTLITYSIVILLMPE